jgi:uncharacterized protein YjbI with pentapeptide repeats
VFVQANLVETNLVKAILCGVNFQEADLSLALLIDADRRPS